MFLLSSSAAAQYSYTIDKAHNANRAGESNGVTVTVLQKGQKVYSVERLLPFDVPYPLVTLNEKTGMLLLRYVFDGFIELYNAEGSKVWENQFFKDEEPNYERTIGAVVGSNAVYVLISDSKWGKAVVRQFSFLGALQWSATLPHQYAYAIALSDDEQTIVAGSYLALEDEVRRSAAIMNTRGEIQGNIDIIFRTARFSPDGSLLALSSEREVVMVSMETKKETARAAKQSNGIITDMIWDNRTLLVQESDVVTPNDGRVYYADPTIIRYSGNLNTVAVRKMTGTSFRSSNLQRNGNTVELVLDGGSRTIVVE